MTRRGKRKKRGRSDRDIALSFLADMVFVHGDHVGDWCPDCLERRAFCLFVLGNPETCVIECFDVVTGESIGVADVANLLPGRSNDPIRSGSSLH